jgi:hypothetical protein
MRRRIVETRRTKAPQTDRSVGFLNMLSAPHADVKPSPLEVPEPPTLEDFGQISRWI